MTGFFRARDGVLRPTLQRIDADTGALVTRFQTSTDAGNGAVATARRQAVLRRRLLARRRRARRPGHVRRPHARAGHGLRDDVRAQRLRPQRRRHRRRQALRDRAVRRRRRNPQHSIVRLDPATGEVDRSFTPRFALLDGELEALAHKGHTLYRRRRRSTPSTTSRRRGSRRSTRAPASSCPASTPTPTRRSTRCCSTATGCSRRPLHAHRHDRAPPCRGAGPGHWRGARVRPLDRRSQTVGQFSSPPPGVDGDQVVDAIVRDGSSLWLGGAFKTAGGQPRTNLVRVDAGTGAVQAPAPNPDGAVLDLEPAGGGAIVAAGRFSRSRARPQRRGHAQVRRHDRSGVGARRRRRRRRGRRRGLRLAIGGTFASRRQPRRLAFFDPATPVNTAAPSIAAATARGRRRPAGGRVEQLADGVRYTWARGGTAIGGARARRSRRRRRAGTS